MSVASWLQLLWAVLPHLWGFSILCCSVFDFMLPTTSTFSGMAQTHLHINEARNPPKYPEFLLFLHPILFPDSNKSPNSVHSPWQVSLYSAPFSKLQLWVKPHNLSPGQPPELPTLFPAFNYFPHSSNPQHMQQDLSKHTQLVTSFPRQPFSGCPLSIE